MKHTYDFSAVIRYGIVALVLVLAYLLFQRLSGVLVPFIVSWFIAYMMCPMVNFFQYTCRFRSRGLSVAVSVIIVLSVLVAFFLLVVPPMMTELAHLSSYVADGISNMDVSYYVPAEVLHRYQGRIAELDWIALLEDEDVMSAVQIAIPKLWQMFTGGVNAIMKLGVVTMCLLYVFFLLLDWEKVCDEAIHLVPAKYSERITMMVKDLSESMQTYFRNQGIVAAIVGVIFAVGFELMGLPLGLAMGLLIGVLSMVPYLKILGIVPSILLAVLQSAETGRPLWVLLLIMLGIFLLAQILDDFVLTPKIMGQAMNMRPAVILLALSIWGSLLGIAGMLIALPITTLMISYYKRFVLKSTE